MCHLVPCLKTTDATKFAHLFLDNVIRLHGIPDSIVSDHGSIFTSHFWKSLASMMDLKCRLSTAFHPQTDGQTECMRHKFPLHHTKNVYEITSQITHKLTDKTAYKICNHRVHSTLQSQRTFVCTILHVRTPYACGHEPENLEL